MSDSYDMGNAGDLLKHGWLAEWAYWWCQEVSQDLRFLDPFGGRPWTRDPNEEVVRRVKALGDTTLTRIQLYPDGRYYGSGHVVSRASREAGGEAGILVSDRDNEILAELRESGHRSLKLPGFRPSDSYSILNTRIEADLLLLDPFGDFLRDRAPTVVPRIEMFAKRTAVMLFALDLNSGNCRGRQFARLRQQHLESAWIARCPKIQGGVVRGESKYEAEVLLVVPEWLHSQVRENLSPRLGHFCARLCDVLGVEVSFQEPTLQE